MPFPTILLVRRSRRSDVDIRRHSSVVEPEQVAHLTLHPKTQVFRQESTHSRRSARSTPTLLIPPRRLDVRDPSSTMTSLNEEMMRSTPSLPSGPASTTTTSRSSFAGLFSLSKLRPSLDSAFSRASPGSPSGSNSKPHSLSLARESVVIPDREPDETPAKYLARLQEVVNRGAIAGALSKSDDAFSQAVLRSYMRSFAFFEDPMDMAIRKLLMKVELPKETQQIDRLIQRFADRYDECNPGIFASADEAYFVAFSLLILQTDAFNKSNKHKMQKQEYIKNTHEYGEGISEDVLACFFDNICYTPFIHVEDDLEISGGRRKPRKGRKSKFPLTGAEVQKKALKEPIDPYSLIIEGRLSMLRPDLKDVMNSEDPYGYLGTAKYLDMPDLQRTFFRWGVLQIVSARSRPDAFNSPMTITNPEDAHPGVVDVKVTKVGVIWRKDVKKKKTRSPWQEWGAILTGSQLYLFKNVTWIKGLLHQYEQHQKSGRPGSPVTFKPPLENFKPDALMSTNDAVALVDASYKKHKNAFIFVRHGGFEETLLAESEAEMNDWLAKLNYAAAFRTAGVRMRAMITPPPDKGPETRRTDPNPSNVSVGNGAPPSRGGDDDADGQLTQQILQARRQIIRQKIQEANDKLLAAQKQLERQLRNSRHLQLLAPIQAKSREQVILAAGRMAAKLKWIRMEIWRVKCHRDVLWLDLKDEGVIPDGQDAPEDVTDLPLGSPSMEVELSQDGGLNNHPRLRSWGSHISIGLSSNDLGSDTEDRKSVGEPAEQFESIESRAAWETVQDAATASRPSSVVDGGSRVDQEPSAANSTGGNQRVASHASSSIAQQHSPTGSATLAQRKPSADEVETQVLKQAGFIRVNSASAEGRVVEPDTGDQAGQTMSDNEGNDKTNKVRRSLHRSLRESHLSGHHPHHHQHHLRHKKGRDSSSSAAAIAEDAAGSTSGHEGGLVRGTGSFTLHGKKASVVTFGSEWQSIAAEDQIRQRKQVHCLSAGDDVGGGGVGVGRRGSGVPSVRLQLVTTATAASSGGGPRGESSMRSLLQSNASDSTMSSDRIGTGHRDESIMPGSWEEEEEEEELEHSRPKSKDKGKGKGKQRMTTKMSVSPETSTTVRYGGDGPAPGSDDDNGEDQVQEEIGEEEGEERKRQGSYGSDTIEWNTVRYSTAMTTDEEYQSAPEESENQS
ncbi:MAG: hypothetical protein M1823_004263 [Watsoniomyces obsoletus]|nr:MAG: hypothetical protein M1823_004263 [Watsoniomyces obsoletus]